LEGGDEAAEPSRGDCSSLPEIDFATEPPSVAGWVQRKFISLISERGVGGHFYTCGYEHFFCTVGAVAAAR
jgi:hypothetical protein